MKGVVDVLGKICRQCGTQVGIQEYFCPRCGNALFAEEAAESPGNNPPPSGVAAPGRLAADGPRGMPARTAGAAQRASVTATPYTAREREPAPVQGQGLPGAQRQAVPVAGTSYYVSREQLRRLIEEDRRRRKILLISIPAALSICAAVFLLLFFFVFRKGMSPEEYKKEALGVHDGVISKLQQVENKWNRSDYSDKPFSWWCDELRDEFTAVGTVIDQAVEELQELQPPEQYTSLASEALSYYEETADYAARAVAVFAFAGEWARIWEEWVETPFASDNVRENMTPADAVALIDQDIACIDQVTKRFQALNPPAECCNMQDGVLSLIQEQRSLFDRLKRSIINGDIDAFEVLCADWDSFDASAVERIVKLWDDMYSFHDEYLGCLDRGYDILEVLKGLKMELEEEVEEGVTAFLAP
jgi:hypothetical protein